MPEIGPISGQYRLPIWDGSPDQVAEIIMLLKVTNNTVGIAIH